MKYEQIKKKYNLPSLNELEVTYDFDLKESTHPTRDILKKIEDKLEGWCDRLQNLIHSDSSLETLFECEFITESDKTQILDIFKEFMGIRCDIQALLLEHEEKAQAEKVKEAHNTFTKHKKLLKKLMLKLSTKWKEQNNTKNDSVKYVG